MDKWISVEDKLPYVGKPVIVYIPDEFPFTTVREGILLQSGMWYVNGREHGVVKLHTGWSFRQRQRRNYYGAI